MRFGEDDGGMNYKYDGQNDPRIHVEACIEAWKQRSVDEWVHIFIHTLGLIPKNWYIKIELRRGTKDWSLLIDGFKSKYPEIDNVVEVIRTKIFEDGPLPLFNQPDWVALLETTLECYNFIADEDEDPRNVNISESEGSCEVEGSKLEVPEITKNVKLKKVNIGTEVDPEIASIGDYWDDETIGHITELLQEYQIYFLPSSQT